MTVSPQTAPPVAPLGIIAGGGTAPRRLMEACRRMGREFFVVCLEGQADRDLAAAAPHVWLPMGAMSRLKEVAGEKGIREVVMIGRVRRPSIMELKPDLLAAKIVAKIGLGMLGDDAVLTKLGKAMEEDLGLRVLGVQDIFAGLLAPSGQLGRAASDEQAQKDIARGVEVAAALGRIDVGQSVIVQQGLVLGVEAIEGTDALIARSAGLRREGPGGVLVKIAKPQQDDRFDLPTIGPDTIAAMAKAGLRGVAVEAGRSLILEREETVAAADRAGIFITGIAAGGGGNG